MKFFKKQLQPTHVLQYSPYPPKVPASWIHFSVLLWPPGGETFILSPPNSPLGYISAMRSLGWGELFNLSPPLLTSNFYMLYIGFNLNGPLPWQLGCHIMYNCRVATMSRPFGYVKIVGVLSMR